MKRWVTNLISASVMARTCSKHGRTIALLIADDGVVVMGSRDGQTEARDVDWRTLDQREDALIEAIIAVANKLR